MSNSTIESQLYSNAKYHRVQLILLECMHGGFFKIVWKPRRMPKNSVLLVHSSSLQHSKGIIIRYNIMHIPYHIYVIQILVV
jgi:hypothetical protein